MNTPHSNVEGEMGWNIVFYVPAESMPAQQYEKKSIGSALTSHTFRSLLSLPLAGLDNFKRGAEIDLQQK